MIQFKPFADLTGAEVHALLKLRFDVFVLEQACLYPEIDGEDPKAVHCLAGDLTALGGTLRIFVGAEAVIGRVAVAEHARGTGLGGDMMRAALAEIGAKPVRLAAQTYLRTWYEKLGFHAASDAYLEDGIAHIDMIRPAP